MSYAPVYVSCVLDEHFDHAKVAFLGPLMAIHRAHLIMLTECGIVSPARGVGTSRCACADRRGERPGGGVR